MTMSMRVDIVNVWSFLLWSISSIWMTPSFSSGSYSSLCWMMLLGRSTVRPWDKMDGHGGESSSRARGQSPQLGGSCSKWPHPSPCRSPGSPQLQIYVEFSINTSVQTVDNTHPDICVMSVSELTAIDSFHTFTEHLWAETSFSSHTSTRLSCVPFYPLCHHLKVPFASVFQWECSCWDSNGLLMINPRALSVPTFPGPKPRGHRVSWRRANGSWDVPPTTRSFSLSLMAAPFYLGSDAGISRGPAGWRCPRLHL